MTSTYIQDKLDAIENDLKEKGYTKFERETIIDITKQSLTDYHNHIVENIKNELGDFAHTRYLGCHSENDKWHYSYDTEVVYIVDEYLKSLQDTNPKE